jgi:hypothetical protein
MQSRWSRSPSYAGEIGAETLLANLRQFEEIVMMLRVLVLAFTLLAPTTSDAAEWSGYSASLWDAQVACADTNSAGCLPYLAEALAVASVLTESARLIDNAKYGVAFHSGRQEICTERWRQAMNGLQLLHLALGFEGDTEEAKRLPWIDALIRASQDRCHS